MRSSCSTTPPSGATPTTMPLPAVGRTPPPAARAGPAAAPLRAGGRAPIRGPPEPLARVELYRSLTASTPALTTQAGADGHFTFTGVAVKSGSNFLRVDAVDV